jgi:hypothetical protein
MLCVALVTEASDSPPSDGQGAEAGAVDSDRGQDFIGWPVVTNLIQDQKAIWSAPAHWSIHDLQWAIPVAGIATGLMMTDRTTSRELTRGTHNGLSDDFSNVGIGAMGLTAGSMYLMGLRNGDDHLHEAGFLAGEAGGDALAVDEMLKFGFRRARPTYDNGSGRFFQGGGQSANASFPSAHAASAFAIATVIAHEYPGSMTKWLSYGAAAAISMSRVTAGQHFPSDAFIGGVMGYWIGRNVYGRHHDPRVENFGTFEKAREPLSIAGMSSTYIELDSWIYPAVERLAARGVIRTEFLGLRPWTRMAVYLMLDGAQANGSSSLGIVEALKTELGDEAGLDLGNVNQAIAIDNIYSRTQYISGTPLNDSYHFGQTIANDFGRPFGHGWQQITGFETRAEQDRFSFFVRGEYQHSPSVPGYGTSVAEVIATQDNIPVQSYPTQPERNVFRLLDTYVSMKLWGDEISVGKQSFWWGPDSSGALALSNNAEPFYSVRLNRTSPLKIPLLSKLMGPARYDGFFGKLSGHQFPREPFFYGQKINFCPTENLELGFSRDAVIAGEGSTPLTFDTFWRSFTSTSSGTYKSSVRNMLGARHGGFDFRYRLPGVRNWLTLYTESLVHDNVSPLAGPQASILLPGIYLSRFPLLPKLDLHVERGSSDITSKAKGGQYYYWEGVYRDGYTNKRDLLGSWLGREGTGGQAWVTYWFNPQSTLQVGYRTLKVSQYFVPQGESQQDFYSQLRYRWQDGVAVQLLVQGERWAAPVLAANPQTNVTAQFQISYSPESWKLLKRQ